MNTQYKIADKYIFDSENSRLTDLFNKNQISLRCNESRMLLCFLENAGDLVSQSALYDFVWKRQGFEVDYASMTQSISLLRKVFDDSIKSPQFIKTYPKQGYKFIAIVKKVETSELIGSVSEILVSTDNDVMSGATDDEKVQSDLNGKDVVYNRTKKIISINFLIIVWAISAIISYMIYIYDDNNANIKKLYSYHNIDVFYLKQNLDVEVLFPTIKNCIPYVLNGVKESNPIKIYVTADKQSSISFNVVLSEKNSITKTIVAISSNGSFEHACEKI